MDDSKCGFPLFLSLHFSLYLPLLYEKVMIFFLRIFWFLFTYKHIIIMMMTQNSRLKTLFLVQTLSRCRHKPKPNLQNICSTSLLLFASPYGSYLYFLPHPICILDSVINCTHLVDSLKLHLCNLSLFFSISLVLLLNFKWRVTVLETATYNTFSPIFIPRKMLQSLLFIIIIIVVVVVIEVL